jgi:isoleucyl-tRNA synthetase
MHLNEIYLAVLKHSISSEYSEEEKDEVYDMLKHILGSIVVLLSPLSTFLLSRLLHLPREDVNRTFEDLYATLIFQRTRLARSAYTTLHFVTSCSTKADVGISGWMRRRHTRY